MPDIYPPLFSRKLEPHYRETAGSPRSVGVTEAGRTIPPSRPPSTWVFRFLGNSPFVPCFAVLLDLLLRPLKFCRENARTSRRSFNLYVGGLWTGSNFLINAFTRWRPLHGMEFSLTKFPSDLPWRSHFWIKIVFIEFVTFFSCFCKHFLNSIISRVDWNFMQIYGFTNIMEWKLGNSLFLLLHIIALYYGYLDNFACYLGMCILFLINT